MSDIITNRGRKRKRETSCPRVLGSNQNDGVFFIVRKGKENKNKTKIQNKKGDMKSGILVK
jgi:hypothetical protein